MIASDAVREKEVSPRASVLVESLRDIGYSLPTAIADVIDNSLTAGARKIELLADTHSEMPAIGILDDGCGMTATELLEAMRPGSRSPRETRADDDLGRFGLGLKTASFSQCRRLTVATRRAGETSCAVWDLDMVAARDRWIVQFLDSISKVRWGDRLTANGTLVVWENLDRIITPNGDGGRKDFVRQLNETADHLEFVFHRFLSGRESRRKPVKMLLNNRALSPFDPFHPASQRHPKETFRLGGQEITIQPMTLPHHDKVSKNDWERYAMREGYVKNQGFYLYRNRRLIAHGTWFGLARQQELTKLSRVRIDIPNNMDAEWKIDVRKASAQPPPAVRQRLRKIVGRLGAPSQRIYKRRGALLTDDNRLPVWTRNQNKNRILYDLNLEHPILLDFVGRLDEESATKFRKLIGLVVSTLPVEALYADLSASQGSVDQQTMSSEDFEEIVTAAWRILRENRLSGKEIKTRMRSAEPFGSRWPETERVIQALEMEKQEDP